MPEQRWQGIGFLRWGLWRLVLVLWTVLGTLIFRPRVEGRHLLPKTGPYLILPNHTSALDPVWAAWKLGRPAHFMASAHLFRSAPLRGLITALGAFPKMKFVRDEASLNRVQTLHDQGQIVMIFPEGRRTWDGRTFPIRAGIGRLIKGLNARVVFCHIETGHLWQPRWARWPRWVPVHIRYHDPVAFPEDWSPEQITQAVQDGIAVDPAPMPEAKLLSYRAAEGIETVLWACPFCFTPTALEVCNRGSQVRCRSCAAALEVTPTNHLLRRDHAHPPLHLAEARDRINAHFGSPPALERSLLEGSEVVLQGEQVTIRQIGGDAGSKTLGRGRLTLYTNRMELCDGDRMLWTLRLVDVRAIAMEMGNVVQLRTEAGLLQLDPGEQSTLMWAHFLAPWHRLARGQAAPS
jgi:1-acyl-sn-glycerol-3-phosphate acyltransferase